MNPVFQSLFQALRWWEKVQRMGQRSGEQQAKKTRENGRTAWGPSPQSPSGFSLAFPSCLSPLSERLEQATFFILLKHFRILKRDVISKKGYYQAQYSPTGSPRTGRGRSATARARSPLRASSRA